MSQYLLWSLLWSYLQSNTAHIFRLHFERFLLICRSLSSPVAANVVSSAYLRLFMHLPPILIPSMLISSPASLMILSPYILNKTGDRMQPCLTPLPIVNSSVSPCSVLTVDFCPSYNLCKTHTMCFRKQNSNKDFHNLA